METSTAPALHTQDIITRDCDPKAILVAISKGVLMSCGARNILNLGDGIHFNVGRGKKDDRQARMTVIRQRAEALANQRPTAATVLRSGVTL